MPKIVEEVQSSQQEQTDQRTEEEGSSDMSEQI